MQVYNWNAAGAIVLTLLAGVSPLLGQVASGQTHVEVGEDVVMFAPAQAGTPVPGTFENMIWHSGEGPAGPAVEPMFTFISAGGGFGGPTVKGSPYSAEAVTEIEQRLADGNRISRKTTSAIYRDSEGRTRRDQTLGAIGPWVVSEQMPRMSTIHDPVASVHYMLDHTHKAAHKLPTLPRSDGPLMGAARMGALAHRKTAVASSLSEGEAVHGTSAHGGAMPGGAGVRIAGADFQSRFRNEALGKQLVEGVEAEGTRSVFTIPAGEIGNDLPIEVVSERWYSPELQAVVLSRHNDPRSGETLYRLTSIQRSEPPLTLFEIPPGYTLIDPKAITTFAQCAAAGHPVLESQPRQCRTPDGRSFVETPGQ